METYLPVFLTLPKRAKDDSNENSLFVTWKIR